MTRPDWFLRGVALFILFWVMPVGVGSWGAIVALLFGGYCWMRALVAAWRDRVRRPETRLRPRGRRM